MNLEPTSAEDIAWACAALRALGVYPEREADDPDAMRAAFARALDGGRTEGLRELVGRFRGKRDFGVWARVQSSRLHRETGDFAAALADIEDLLARFPAREGAHWHVARARALIGLKREDDAEAALREGVRRFPADALPRVILANLISKRGRAQDALEVWRELHAAVAAPDLDAWLGFSNALKAAGRREESLAALDEIGRRFPDDPRTPPLLAGAAEARGQGARALEIWDAVATDDGIVGRAGALFRLDRIDEAMAALESVLARRPDHAAALREAAALYGELGEVTRARDLRVRWMQAHADEARPEAWAMLARAHHKVADYDAGGRALAELERRFPDSPLAERERIRLAKEREYGLDDLQPRIEAARRRFPKDFDLRAHWVWILLSLGALDDAEREVEALEREGAGGLALSARLGLEADRGDDNLRFYLERLDRARVESVADAMQVAYRLIEIRTPSGFALGDEIADATAARHPRHIGLNLMRARLKIALRQDAAALALIDATPPRFVRREALELRAWAATQRGAHDEAKALWRQALAGAYYPAVAAPIFSLTRLSPDARPPAGAGVTAYVVLRNESALIPAFLAHHRKLGVRRFVFFDHGSTDGGREIALSEPDVIVYDAPDSFQLASYGRRWVNEIVAREGASGWGLQLDTDEHLIYPGCESLGIDGFVNYLDAHGFEAVRGFMLDVFAPRLIGDDGLPAPPSEHVWYDDDYSWIGHARPPYLSPIGGVRSRLFEAKEYLHKVLLWRLDAGQLINSHETTAMRFADVSAALLHFKMMNVSMRGRERTVAEFVEADADVEVVRRHSRYAARLASLWRADLRAPGASRRLEDSLALAGRGLMEASDNYRRWLGARAR